MKPTQMKELLPVAEAYAAGKVVQWLGPVDRVWRDYRPEEPDSPGFLETSYEWRVKPEPPPTPEEWWLCSCGRALPIGRPTDSSCFFCCSLKRRRVREVLDEPAPSTPQASEAAPEPAKREPKRIWVNEYAWGFGEPRKTKEEADAYAAQSERLRCTEYVEVVK